jgi:hypothetical protein
MLMIVFIVLQTHYLNVGMDLGDTMSAVPVFQGRLWDEIFALSVIAYIEFYARVDRPSSCTIQHEYNTLVLQHAKMY